MLRWQLRDKQRCSTALQQVFHLPGYRPGQEQAVRTLLSGRDLLCVFPTGGGKSLCYQLPAVVMRQPVLVVSPLIALMRDQTAHLCRLGVRAACLDSMQSREEQEDVLDEIVRGRVKLIYVSPERLTSPRFCEAVCRRPLGMVVVDEAHCVVSWGDSFRPAYAQIGAFLAQLPARPVVCAMTATADERMQRQIVASLGMVRPKRIMLPLIRDNLTYQVVTTIDPVRTIAGLCRNSGKTIIFCRTRRRTERLAAVLRKWGIDAAHYHAGLSPEVRAACQERFARGQVRVLTATSAFGMGVDIPDIRLVIMDSVPDQMTDLIQQTGRAGRDGQPAGAVLLLDPLDLCLRAAALRSRRNQVVHGSGDPAALAGQWSELRRVLRLYLDGGCIPAAMARSFGQRAKDCGRCSACLRAQKKGSSRKVGGERKKGLQKEHKRLLM